MSGGASASAEELLRMHHDVVAALATGDLTGVLSAVGCTLGYELGVLWELDGAAQLAAHTTWICPHGLAPALHAVTASARYATGEGNAGRAWATRVIVSSSELAHEVPARATVLRDEGFVAGTWIPVIFAEEVLGVIELLRRHPATSEPLELDCLRSVGQLVALAQRSRQAHAQWAAERTRRHTLETQLLGAQHGTTSLQSTLQCLHDSDVVGIGIGSLDGVQIDANDAWLRIVGYERADLVAGIRWDQLTPPACRAADAYAVEQLITTGLVATYEKEFVRKDGRHVSVLVGAVRIPDTETAIYFVIDNTHAKASERSLAALNAELEERVTSRGESLRLGLEMISAQNEIIAASEGRLRALTQRLMLLREDTGRSIAREIHDVLGTELTGLKLDLAWVIRRLHGQEELVARLQAALGSLDRLVSIVRRIATDLRPEVLDHLGLVAALRWYARELASRSELEVVVEAPEQVEIAHECATALFRIVQELLTNVVRHARATTVRVVLTVDASMIELQVTDDGVGIDLVKAERGSSLGLVGVRERARASARVRRDARARIRSAHRGNPRRGAHAAGRLMRLLIADDHAIIRRGIRELLAEEFAGADFVEAATGEEAVASVAQGLDLVVIDISMPGRGGIDAITELHAREPRLPIIVLSQHAATPFALAALQAGARAYVTKDRAPEELIHAVHTVLRGKRYITPALAEQLVDALASPPTGAPHDLLSNRELQILRMLGAGKSIMDISRELSISDKTASTYRRRVLDKLALNTTAELIRYAIKAGLSE